MRTLIVSTPDLENDDVVLTHGMRVRLTNKRRTEHEDGNTYAFDGEVLNGEDLTTVQPGYKLPRIPASMLSRFVNGKRVPGYWWTIQGNERAAWTVEQKTA